MRKTTALLLSWLLVAAAQQTAPPPGQQAPPPAATPAGGIAKFSVDSQLVIETVTVVDKNGKPIEGLKQEDFKVTENGQPQEIKFFEFQKFEDQDASSGMSATPTVAAAPKPTTPPPPGVIAT